MTWDAAACGRQPRAPCSEGARFRAPIATSWRCTAAAAAMGARECLLDLQAAHRQTLEGLAVDGPQRRPLQPPPAGADQSTVRRRAAAGRSGTMNASGGAVLLLDHCRDGDRSIQ